LKHVLLLSAERRRSRLSPFFQETAGKTKVFLRRHGVVLFMWHSRRVERGASKLDLRKSAVDKHLDTGDIAGIL